MKEVITPHSLRTIILQFDESKTAPEFETTGLAIYYEMHDRYAKLSQHIREGREQATTFYLQVEQVNELYKEASAKFKHLKKMVPDNPDKPRVTKQLKLFLNQATDLIQGFMQALIKLTIAYFDYDEWKIKEDKWLMEVAFPVFNQIVQDYENCSVDLVSFDSDLDDFKSILAHFQHREAKYLHSMEELTDTFSEVNYELDSLYEEIEAFDKELLDYIEDPSRI